MVGEHLNYQGEWEIRRLSVVSIDDIPHGYKLENGTFVGMMGKFQRGVRILDACLNGLTAP